MQAVPRTDNARIRTAVLVGLAACIQLGEPWPALAIFGIVAIIRFVIGNLIDPMLLGQALRLSSFGIILSLAVWGAVWGIPGMFLSAPILVALMIVLARIPALRPVAILLSREGLPDDDDPVRPAAAIGRMSG